MQLKNLCLAAAGAAALFGLAARAHAHAVTVDGVATDWQTRGPGVDGGVQNLGEIIRTANGGGEYVWRDPAGDARTDFVNPETEADLTYFRVTGDATGISILAQTAAPPGSAIELQVAIDLDSSSATDNGNNYFAGNSNTQTSPGAKWEYLLQTQFTQGDHAGALLAGNYLPVASSTVAAARGTDGIEVQIPWSNLGLSGPPSTPIRFTVATFREDPTPGSYINTLHTGSSDALDALTNSGSPFGLSDGGRTVFSDGGFFNTWDGEVSDGIINYSFDIYFNTAGEPYAPVVIDRVVPNSVATSSSDEWVVVRNVGPVNVALDTFKIGDLQVAGTNTEGMYVFPAGASLGAGASFVVAKDGTRYKAIFNTLPDAQFSASDAGSATSTAPAMVKYSAWAASTSATATWALGNAGDEVLLLDRADTIVDAVNYGTSTFGGQVPYVQPDGGAPDRDIVMVRNAAGTDTDNSLNDFTGVAASVAGCGTCGPCTTCVNNMCVPVTAGTTCGTATACTAAPVCDAHGACLAPAPLPANTPCDDNTVCNGRETCDGQGTCKAGTALTCTPGACQTASCDAVTGCAYANKPAGSDCSDGVYCNGAETCDANGACQPGTAVVCNDNNPCTQDSCDNVQAKCVFDGAALNGTSCADSNACNGAESCQNGTCTAGMPVVCQTTNPCRLVGTCSPADGSCSVGDPTNEGGACTLEGGGSGLCSSGTCVAPPTTSSSGSSTGSGSTSGSSSSSTSSGSTTSGSTSSGSSSGSTTGSSSGGTTGSGSSSGSGSGSTTGHEPSTSTSGSTTGTHGSSGSSGSTGYHVYQPPSTDEGCNCSASSSGSASSGLLGFGALLVLGVSRRRRRS